MSGVPAHAEALALIGFMAAGKSTLGPPLAQVLGLGFVDLDAEIESAAGCSIPEIFAQHGEPGFRDLESRVLGQVLGRGAHVLACGGGVVERPENLQLLKRWGHVVWLDLPFSLSLERMGEGSGRPLAADPQLRARYERRQAAYAQADLRLDARQDTAALVQAVLEHKWA
ncbi:MAG: shikimate kinase [Myxococcota bacterium]|nr:shikimate kinase [Myxococcota bacterium]